MACSRAATRSCLFFSASSSSFSRLSNSRSFSSSSAIFSAFISGFPFALAYSYKMSPGRQLGKAHCARMNALPPATSNMNESPITSANKSTALPSGKGLNLRFQMLCSLGRGLSFASFLATSSSFVCSSCPTRWELVIVHLL